MIGMEWKSAWNNSRVVRTLLYILGTRNECCNGMEGRVGIAPVLSTELKLTISFPLRHYWNYAEILKSATSSIVAFLFLDTVVSDKGIACICLYCVGTLH